MKHHFYKEYKIELFIHETYTSGSADNVNTYSNEYFSNEDSKLYKPHNYGIKLLRDNTEINSSIILSCCGFSGVHETSSIIFDNRLLVCCDDYICCLSLPELKMLWNAKTDFATCFQIFKLNEDFIIHG